jgi:hypothetical protein
LRDFTEWIFVPAIEDPGQIKMFPCAPFGEYMVEGLEKFKKVTLAPNPLRVSFLGKEIVLCRYNYLKKLKQNHHPRINIAQTKYTDCNPEHPQVDDFYKVAKTILR